VSPDDGVREGWDPTRPLAEGEPRPRRADPGPAADGSPEDAGGPGAEDAAEPGAHGIGEAPSRDAGAGEAPVLLPHLERLAALATRASGLEEGTARYAAWVERTLRAGGKLLVCGNGGSAATAEHVAAEYVVRFERSRRPLPAVALTGSGPTTTAAANDFSFAEVFERQIAALAGGDDLVVLHSTSGESENLVRAARAAREAGSRTVGLLAAGGGRLADAVDLALVVPTDEGARAQELHLAVEHAVVDRVEAAFADEGSGRAEAGGDGSSEA
jgi:D-sedoheptulose 7-phosphate isomerase